MNELKKMQSAIEYIIECKWTNKSVDCFGNKLTMGMDLDEVRYIQRLSLFIGKAQVYQDKREEENFRDTINAFWNVFTEDYNMNDFDEFYSMSNE